MLTALDKVTSEMRYHMTTLNSSRNTRKCIARDSSAGRWWGLAALAVAAMVGLLDMTVVVTALPTLSVKLGASTGELQWVMDAYTLVLAGLVLPAGVLGDRFGRRRVLLIGLVVFGISSAAASQMTSAGGLIAMRIVMGAGASAITVLTFSILPSMFSDDERPRAVAVTTAAAFLGAPLGPLVAGFLLERFAWGSIFLINVPVVVVAVVGVLLLVPESRDARPPRIDWTGVALSVSGVTALVYGIIEQPTYGWGSARVLTGLIGGVAILALFVVQQLKTRTPLVDLRLFRLARFSWSIVAFGMTTFALGGFLFILAPFLQLVQGNDAQATGIRLLPVIGGLIVGAAPTDRLTARWGTKTVVASGLVVTAVGSIMLSRVGADTGFPSIAAAEAVIGLGLGLSLPTAADAVLGAVPAAATGSGFALMRTAQFIAMSLGVAVLGTILNGAYRGGLDGHLTGLPLQVQTAAEQGVGGAAAVPHVFVAARTAYADGMTSVMLTSAAVLLLAALLVVLFLPARATPRTETTLAAPEADSQETPAAPSARRARMPAPAPVHTTMHAGANRARVGERVYATGHAMSQGGKLPRGRRAASRAARPCPERARNPSLPPPRCCPLPEDTAERRRIERRARNAQAVAGDDVASARALRRREEHLLGAEIALARRQALALECGIECLEADIDDARKLTARKLPSMWGAVGIGTGARR